MNDFLSAARDLKTLSLSFKYSGSDRLLYMVGTTIWASLRVVQFDAIDAEEQTLIDFLKRHTGTLKELELDNMFLYDGGWNSALPRIRDAVRLEDFRAHGNWGSVDPQQCWFIHTSLDRPLDSLEDEESVMSRAYKSGLAVNRYVLEGGDCPLLDPLTYAT